MDLWNQIDRREFLRRSAWLLPAFHGGLLAAAPAKQAADVPVSLRTLTLRTHRPDELATFYREVLELPVEVGSEIVVRAGTSQIRFLPVDDGSEPFYHFAFTIPENKLERAIAWMQPRCPLLDRGSGPVVHFRNIDAHSVYFYDPAGNILEFIAHHRLRNGAHGSFSAKDILWTSEIGLVTPDVPRLVGDLAELGFRPYTPPSEVFTPVGDIHGLFIVVKSERMWLMTDDPAEIYPVEVALASPPAGELRFSGRADLPYRIS